MRKRIPPVSNPKPPLNEGKWLARSVSAVIMLLLLPFVFDVAMWLFGVALVEEFPDDGGAVVQLLLFLFLMMVGFFGLSMMMTMGARYGVLKALSQQLKR